MASTFVFTNNTYAGEVLAGFNASTLLEGNAVSRGLLTVIPNVKKRQVILKVDDEIVLQEPSAIFNDQNTQTTQVEKYLDPVPYEFMKQESWIALVQSWESQQLPAGSMQDYDGVVDLSDFMMNRYKDKLQPANEQLFYLGKGSIPGIATFSAAYPGLLPKMKVDVDVPKMSIYSYGFAASAISALGVVTVASTANLRNGDVVTITEVTGDIEDDVYGAIEDQSYFIIVLSATTFKLRKNYTSVNNRTPAAFTGTASAAWIQFINAGNILSIMGALYASYDYADRIQSDFRVQAPLHVIHALKQAYATQGINVLGAFINDIQADYLGMKIEGMNFWLANTIVAARTSNLLLGVDLMSDENSLQTVDMRNYTLDQVVRIKGRMKSDVNYLFSDEILYCGPLNANNS